MMRDLVLGLDGGGSKTVAAVVDRDGTVVTLARGPGLDPHGNPDWRADLADIARTVGTGTGDLAHAVVGLSCHTESVAISAAQVACVAEVFAYPAETLNDVHVAFEGALGGGAGVLALAGTGSMAWAGDGHGLHRRCGGWGDLIGDEGSGYWVGREALGALTRSLDGRAEAEDFAEALLRHLAIGPDQVIEWVHGLAHRRAGIAALAKVVDRLATDGEPTACDIMRRGAGHLSLQAETAWRLVGSSQPLIWSYAGGLFASALLRRLMAERLGPPVDPVLPPVGGAILVAARTLGWDADAGWRSRLAASLATTNRPGGLRA